MLLWLSIRTRPNVQTEGCIPPRNYSNPSTSPQFAAWLGLTPKQHSTGGKTRLGRITKRGDAYLRTLLILGAKSALQAALRKPPAVRHRLQQWIVTVLDRIGYHKTLVAIANKHARIIWALLVKGEDFVVQHLTPKVVAGA